MPSACAWRSDGEPEHSHWRPRWHSRQWRQGAYHDRATARPHEARVQARPDGLDHARALVPQDDRPRPLPVAVADVQVGVADARCGHPHEDLARARVVEPQRLDGAPLARALDDGRLDLAHDPTMPDPPDGYPVFWSPAAMPLIVTPMTVRSAASSAGARSGARSRPSSSTWTADSAST